MIDFSKMLGVQSWSFREFASNEDCAKAICDCNGKTVEIAGNHINYDQPETWQGIIDTYRSHGIAIASCGVVGMTNDEAVNRRYFEFAKLAGCKMISISFGPQDMMTTIGIVERLSEEYGILTGIHNHGGYDFLGNTSALKYVFNHSSARIGLTLDTGWCIQTELCNPVQWMKDFSRRIYGFHFKDFSWHENGKHYDRIVGEGALDLPGVIAAAKNLENVKFAVIEYEGANAFDCTKKSIENVLKLN